MSAPSRFLPCVVLGLLAAVALPACNGGSSGCQEDSDCPAGFYCLTGICHQRIDGGEEPDAGGDDGGPPPADDGGEPPSDDGGLPPADDGGLPPADDGGAEDAGDPGGDSNTAWLIQPGIGIGALRVSGGLLTNVHTLGEVRSLLGEQGVLAPNTTYTMTFRGDTLWVVGIDVNDSKSFDNSDHVLSITARTGFDARTTEGLGPGSSFALVHSTTGYTNPDRTAVLPASGEYPGGKIDEFFGLGLLIGYDESDVSSAFTVIRSLVRPDATINPSAGTLRFGSTTIMTGTESSSPGSERDLHRGVLGNPDWASTFERDVTTGQDGGTVNVGFYLDSYRIQGMEFVGMERVSFFDVDRLVAVALYPLFYGRTAAGHGLGSTKAEWEQELGAPVDTVQDVTYNGVLYIYNANLRKFAVMYGNDGASQSDPSVLLVLNYQEG